MNSPVDDVRRRILSPDFLCWPAKAAVKQKKLPILECPGLPLQEMQNIIRDGLKKLFSTPATADGVVFVSPDSLEGEGVTSMLPALGKILLEIHTICYAIGNKDSLAHWPLLAQGQGIGNARYTFQRANGISDEIIITAHGPAYPGTHPRFQPHPSLVIILESAVRNIDWYDQSTITNHAHTQAGSDYSTDTFLLPLNGSREF